MLFNNKKQILFVLSLLITIGLSGCPIQLTKQVKANEFSSIHSAATAPLFNNLGNHHHPISTNSKLAQRFFDQGLILAYGFNHAEAARSFKEAARLDPNCAMCYWGMALVKGPNINAAMEKEAVPETVQAMKKAIELSKMASEKE